jgi:hypothetical protein
MIGVRDLRTGQSRSPGCLLFEGKACEHAQALCSGPLIESRCSAGSSSHGRILAHRLSSPHVSRVPLTSCWYPCWYPKSIGRRLIQNLSCLSGFCGALPSRRTRDCAQSDESAGSQTSMCRGAG